MIPDLPVGVHVRNLRSRHAEPGEFAVIELPRQSMIRNDDQGLRRDRQQSRDARCDAYRIRRALEQRPLSAAIQVGLPSVIETTSVFSTP